MKNLHNKQVYTFIFLRKTKCTLRCSYLEEEDNEYKKPFSVLAPITQYISLPS